MGSETNFLSSEWNYWVETHWKSSQTFPDSSSGSRKDRKQALGDRVVSESLHLGQPKNRTGLNFPVELPEWSPQKPEALDQTQSHTGRETVPEALNLKNVRISELIGMGSKFKKANKNLKSNKSRLYFFLIFIFFF